MRLNVAHLSVLQLEEWLATLAEIRKNEGLDFRVILDLQGAKVRIGRIPAVEKLPGKVCLFLGSESLDAARIPVPCQAVFAQTRVGERLFLNDRKIVLEVCGQGSDFIEARVLQNGPLSSAKGINSPDRVFAMARVMPGDAAAIAAAADYDFVSYALSFVADGSETSLFRPLTASRPLIAKIEQTAAFAHLAEIAAGFDELWLCRGDLGAEAGLSRLGFLQQQFVRQLKELQKPCLLAGEVLGSMVVLPQPSRAEIVQLYDALSHGFAGFVLSDETAAGQQVEAVLHFIETFFCTESVADKH